ncbi:hypothetical protein HPP92_008162 [Vanilla planifolia]|uniref:Uncharacterized protein n=1 Tax=Vanilla planifolia TaxID=51239 RepID=A0A835RBL2_VANPL|nr:hypothetical protein HPP92_008162 [Vanilla planifolia]
MDNLMEWLNRLLEEMLEDLHFCFVTSQPSQGRATQNTRCMKNKARNQMLTGWNNLCRRGKEHAIIRTRPILEEAIGELCNTISAETLVIADLGCASGPNAFRVISEIIASVEGHYIRSGLCPPEIQYFLNDLPGNDFNSLFRSPYLYERRTSDQEVVGCLPLYVVGLPGSFYGRLFPLKSVHLFYSSYSLHWLSQVPRGLEDLESNIYITEESSPNSWKVYLEQYERDFSRFLKLRSKELFFGGRMILTSLGRGNPPTCGENTHLWRLLSDALRDMAFEGIIQWDKLKAFKLPIYFPLMEEVKAVVEKEGSLSIEKVHTFESNWDPLDESNEDFVLDEVSSGQHVASCIRAVVEPLLSNQFGDGIIDDLFSRLAKNVAKHMLKGKPKYLVFVLLLKLKG